MLLASENSESRTARGKRMSASGSGERSSRRDCGRTGLEVRGFLQHKRLHEERRLDICSDEGNVADFRLVEELRRIRGWRS